MLRNGQTRGLKAASILASALLGVLSLSPLVIAGPQGGTVSAGSGSISQPNAAVTNVIQNTHRMAVDWQSFNLGASETVNFNQPSASAAVLNRIHDQNPSQIFGAINANGRVFLANPNGIIFGQTATVNVGALIAAGMNISNDDFMAGNYKFTAGENGTGVVVNRGLINAATGGSVGLLGSTVINEGIIVADYGNIELASGNRAVVNFDGDGLLNIQVSEDVINNAVENDAAVSNRGSLLADGGQVVLTAHAASDVFDNAINNEGIIRAARIDNTGGVIRLVGNSGTVLHSGEINAQGENGTGGTVHVLGDRVGLIGDASIDTSGDSGGGTVLIGGDYQGNGDIQTARRTFVGSSASINADAIETGDGGQVVVWADEDTRYYGTISSRGGATAGNGGDVEVSGKRALDFDGAVDVTAQHGAGGTVLLDPDNITLNNGPTSVPPGDMTNQNQPVGTADILRGTDLGSDYTINVAEISGFDELFLQAANDISLLADLTMTHTVGSIIFQADRHININQSLEVTGTGSITLTADVDGGGGPNSGTISFGSNGFAKTAGGDIIMSASEFSITNLAATVIDAGTGTVTITTSTAGKQIDIGDDAGTGINNANMDIDIAELGKISAGTLSIGTSTHTGNINVVTNDVSFSTTDIAQFRILNEGDVIINQALSLTGGVITINADAANDGGSDSINRSGAGSLLSAGTINLTASNGIGTAATKLLTATQNLNFSNTTTSGSVQIDNDVVAGNTVNISGSSGSDIVITEVSGNLTIATTGITTTGQLDLIATGGAITDTASGVITAGTLVTSSATGTDLTAATHVVGAFDATNSGAGVISLNNASGGTLNITGIDQSGTGQVTITETDNINLTGAISAGANTVSLSSANGNISGNASGVITAGLLATSSDTGTDLIAATHIVDTFGASNTGAGVISLDNASGGTLNITGIDQSGTGQVTITETGNINLTGDINAGANGVTLTASGGGITGNASIITAATLDTTSVTGTDLSGAINVVEAFTASNNGTGVINLNNASSGTLNITGISQTGTGLVTITETGVISVGGSGISAGSNDVELRADRMAISNTITAGTVSLQTNTPGRLIDLGLSTTDVAVNTLELSTEELNFITADTLSIGEATSGTITISADIGTPTVTDLHLTTSDVLNVNADINNITGTVQLTADTMTIPITGSITATGRRVILQPLTAGRQIDLGLATTTNTLGLTDQEITRISAGTLEIGNTTAGDITISADITPAVTNALHLVTAGNVTGTDGGILGDKDLAIKSSGSVNITAANTDVSTLAVVASQDVTFTDINSLSVGDVDVVTGTLSGISGNNISLATTAGLLSVVSDINASGSVQLTAQGNTVAVDGLNIGAGATVQGSGDHTYTADFITFDGDVNAIGQRVTLQSFTPGFNIELGVTDVGMGASLRLENKTFDGINADTVVIGNVNAGTIDIESNLTTVDLMDITNLHLVTGGDVSGTAGGILGDKNLAIEAGGIVNITGATLSHNEINTLAINTNGNITFTNVNGFSIGNVDGVQGISTSSDVILTSTAGSITDGNLTGPDITGTRLDVNAQTGIGAGDPLETSIDFLEATNSTSGNIEIVESDHITVDIADNTNGDIDIQTVNGSISVSRVGAAIFDRIKTQGASGSISFTTNGTSGALNISVNDNITAVDNITLNAVTDIVFNPDIKLETSALNNSGDISLRANGTISGNGELTIDAGGALSFDQALSTNGDTSLKASQMDITKNITVAAGDLDIISDNPITISPDITIESAGRLSIEHPDDNIDMKVATEGRGNLDLIGASINLPGDMNVNGNLTLNSLGVDASVDGLDIKGAVSTTTSGDISIIANDLVLDGSIASVGTVTIADNGNKMLLFSNGDGVSLHISTNEYDRISASGLFLTSTDLTIQESFISSPSTVPLTINATSVSIPQVNTQIKLQAGLDFADSNVTAGPGLDIDVGDGFAMNNQLNVTGQVSIKAATDITMGLPSEITTTNGQVDMVTTGGDVLLGLIDAGNANVNVTASAGSILNNNGVSTDFNEWETNVRSANVTLDANRNIGLSSTDAVTLDINSEGLITLDFGEPKAFINNLNNTRIVNQGSGEVAIGIVFSNEIIGTGHNVGVNNERDPPGANTDRDKAKRAPEMISVVGADYKAVPLDEEEEITSTLSPTVPVLIRTTRGWEFKAPSRTRQPGDTGDEPKKGTRYIDWL